MMTKGKKRSAIFAPSTRWGKIPCRISRSGFSNERVFEIVGESSSIRGVSSRNYCLDANGEEIGHDVPPLGEFLDGYIVARIIEEDGIEVTVSLPSGDVVAFSADNVLALEP